MMTPPCRARLTALESGPTARVGDRPSGGDDHRLSRESDAPSPISVWETVFPAICAVARAPPLSGQRNGALIAVVQSIRLGRRGVQNAAHATARAGSAEGDLRGMLLPVQSALRPGPARAVRDVPSQRGRAEAASAVAVCLSTGAPLARRLGVPVRAGAGR